MPSRLPGLSKTRFQAGLQCPKQLWLRCYRPELADPISAVQQAVFDQGHLVGDLARRRFPDGVLVAEDHLHGAAALRSTADRLAQGCRCLYEAALGCDGVLVRSDILREEADGWHLIEVKSTTGVKAEHETDLAIQAHVLRGAGLPLGRASLLHLNREYVYAGGPYDLEQLFTLADLTAEVEALLPQIPGMLAELQECLLGPCPETLVGRHCTTPYNCAFLGHCHGSLPAHPVTEIPRIADDVLHGLLAGGICRAADVPPFYPGLTPTQRTACEVLRTGRPRVGAGLARDLAELHPPLHFLDFETFQPALPLHPGTHPYHLLPVQWSCHTLRADGRLEHREFLHQEATDPRLPAAQSLLQALSAEPGTIVVYHTHEQRVLSGLAADLPQLAPALHDLSARLFDLHRVIATHVHHPDFHGRTSLKYVLPALVDDLSYADLAIRDGQEAMLRYQAAVHGTVSEEERRQIFADLRAYCGTDTLALVRLLAALGSLTAGGLQQEAHVTSHSPLDPHRLSDHARANRDYWNQESDAYQERNGPMLAASGGLGWGVWQIREAELQVLGEVAGKDVLELGCGAAQWSIALARLGARPVGLDISEQQLAHARRLMAEAGVDFPLLHAGAEEVPLPDASFDIVFSDWGATSFCDPYLYVPEVKRLLRPGGLFAFSGSTPFCELCWKPPMEVQGDRLLRDYFGLHRIDWEDGTAEFMLPYGEWIRLFRRNHFEVEDLIELQPAADAVSTYVTDEERAWCRRWPREQIWKVRKASGAPAPPPPAPAP